MKTNFSFSSKGLSGNLKKLSVKAKPKQYRNAMAHAGMMLLRDSIMESPTVPLLEGELRGSGTVFVDSKKTGDAKELGQSRGTPASSMNNTKKGQITASAGFNKEYAAKMHEHPEYNFSEPSAGGNYILAKLQRYRKSYFQAAADYLKKNVMR